MKLKILSLLGLLIAVSGLLFLIEKNYILSKNPVSITIQILAIAFMIWARITFGLRSFHATANTTQGELVTSGPYKWLRHPIYAAIIYFSLASIIAFPYLETVGAVALIIFGLSLRIFLEEKSLLLTYDNYAAYSIHTQRIIPFIF